MNCLETTYITTLKSNQIFVFGSNLKGYHGLGAAKQALDFGARMYVGVGREGQTYAIPTKDYNIKDRLSLDEIQKYVDDFIQYVIENPQLDFLVTEVGCGFSKYLPSEIAPLFKNAVHLPNIFFTKTFFNVLNEL